MFLPRARNNLRPSTTMGRRVNNPLGGIPFLRNYLQSFNLDPATSEFIVSSAWREGTVKLYANYLRKWGLFCLTKNIKPLAPSIAQVCRFLRSLAEEGLGFEAVNTARCILPRIDGQTVGKHQLVRCSMQETLHYQSTQSFGTSTKCLTL